MSRYDTALVALALACAPCLTLAAAPAETQRVEIRRTTDGIPHLRAANWYALGRGVGYVQAEDALCTLAEAFVTYEGRRSWFFGEDERPARLSTFGRPRNLELDFFWRGFADDKVVAAYRAAHPPELTRLIEGYAAGYNRYLADARAGAGKARACLNEPWVREISATDIYRRMYSAQVAAGYARFIPEIVNAQPAAAPAAAQAQAGDALREKLSMRIGEQAGLGSNALALGGDATGRHGSVLFGNPHWYWGGPDRFYQMHLTIPGKLNVAGVAFLGIPVVMIGFNDQVAWSHTVSAARRFGLFDLNLVDGQAERYRVDGTDEPMTATDVSVTVRQPDGGSRTLTRTLHQTRYGPVIDLGGHHPAFGWSAQKALAIRDVNADNFRIFRNFFYWNQASSLADFIAIQRREAAVPWVNTVAIGRGDNRVWYGDVSNVPNAPDTLRARCATPLGQAFATLDPLTPVLDGSRADCNWLDEAGAAQRGAMPAGKLPGLLRTDYVANMNDSYWLTNVAQPLEGFAAVLGGERQALSLRTRLGHTIARSFVTAPEASPTKLLDHLENRVLAAEVYSAQLFKDEALQGACHDNAVTLRPAPKQGAAQDGSGEVRQVEVGQACQVLRDWRNVGDANARGALLWEAFWERIERTPEAERYRVPFSATAPLTTPSGLKLSNDALQQALAGAVEALAAEGVAPGEPLGERRYVASGGGQVPLYGGCHVVGYFTVTCGLADDGHVGPDAVANSYLQLVRFDRQGVEARTLLAHGEDEDAVRGGAGSEPVRRYADKAWLRFPFSEAEIRRDAGLSRRVLD
ncbi:penicillin acylase family protein [Chitiniphilus eburneus]|uniref:Penicillin acylase family protein n=1 Tax=Chitiniphilus eburneus TaxID=2571148 RepID=A0A4V5MNG9_9NEIS|nr:penicillin acylase family protein [Chitiniphilus eburneus]TJZ64738.1 penicillin acylase family protein [Chitiniphilus eburneus]